MLHLNDVHLMMVLIWPWVVLDELFILHFDLIVDYCLLTSVRAAKHVTKGAWQGLALVSTTSILGGKHCSILRT